MTPSKEVMTFTALLILSIAVCTQAGPVPDTGQTQSYTDTFGEDSDYTINPQSYTKLDGQGNAIPDSASSWAMVKDNVTGLIWEVKSEGGKIQNKNNVYNWNDAQSVFITQLNELNFGGYSDWRLPTVKELASIVNSGRSDPSINTDYFPNTMSSRYWSSTVYIYNSDSSWYVDFDEGGVWYYNKSNSYYVRAVRGGHSSNTFMINGDGTVTDTSTGLMWQQETSGPMTWESAVSYCKGIVLGGRSDWRLPNRNEIQSVVDYATYFPAIDTIAFPDTISEGYWSSTTSASNSVCAWFVYFDVGVILKHYYKSFPFYVRAVRGPHTYINLPAGWNMVSLPVAPDDATASTLFPGAKAIYKFERQKGYKRVKPGDSLETGRGYWILLSEGKTFTLIGAPIDGYTHTVSEGCWAMIGGCSRSGIASATDCSIAVIYGYTPGDGYQRVSPENLDSGKGYWIFLNNVGEQAELRVTPK